MPTYGAKYFHSFGFKDAARDVAVNVRRRTMCHRTDIVSKNEHHHYDYIVVADVEIWREITYKN